MRILLLHNRYQFRGGEDVCVEAQQTVLAERGHTVKLVEATNDEIHGPVAKLRAAASAVYSLKWRARVAQEITRFQPDIVHVHNSFPLLSPSVIYAAKAARVPVVQTLHNYRLLCPNALLYRDGHVCEECIGSFFPWRGVAHKCYRGSMLGTAAVGLTYSLHHLLGTYNRVDTVVVLTEFARAKLAAAGIPEANVAVVPNWLDHDPGVGRGAGGYVLYAGRLSQEKGIDLLVDSWRSSATHVELKIAGEGPLVRRVAEAQAHGSAITYLGQQTSTELYSLMRNAIAVIAPSACYEGLPRVLVESFAAGTPVIASKLGSFESLVKHGVNGLHFRPGDAQDMMRQVTWLFENPAAAREMRQGARATYETSYTAERGYEMLMAVYESALERAAKKQRGHET